MPRPGGTGWVPAAQPAFARARHSTRDWSKLTSFVTAFTALAALVFTAMSLTATRDQINVAEQGQITDRYTKAVDQIGIQGVEHLETRLGGIYALERLARDSPRDQSTIIEVLSAFARGNAPVSAGRPVPAVPALRLSFPAFPDADSIACLHRPVTLDVQAALTVLGRRDQRAMTTARWIWVGLASRTHT